jgi:predicted SAM-dependent methyltransferase
VTDSLTRAADGTVNLHIWREGQEYLRQKGAAFVNQWNNVVFAARPGPPLPNTRYLDLSASPLGFADETFDAVYAYHVFEHLTPWHGERCARQIFSALKVGGIFRLSVPDLETACRQYLHALEAATAEPTRQNTVRYRWAVMAIFEQMVREHSGGMMLDAINEGAYDDAQLRDMFGDMLLPLVEQARSANSGGVSDSRQPGRMQQRRSSHARTVLRRFYRTARTMLGKSHPTVRNRLDPRVTKEAGQWMYDRFSLRLLLEHAGFEDINQVDHVSSSIPRWSAYDFDRSERGGYPLDPSVYMECRKLEQPHRSR